MDPDVRDLHDALHPEPTYPEVRYRQGTVSAYQAGPPRTADITIAGGTNTVRAPLLECCAALTAGDNVWVIVQDDMYLVLARER